MASTTAEVSNGGGAATPTAPQAAAAASASMSGSMTAPSCSAKIMDCRIGFIGAGQMALALAKGFMSSGMVAPNKVFM